MNLMTMSYKDFLFPQNPTELQIREERTVKEAALPLAGAALWDLGAKKRRVTGEGYFTGPDCWETWSRLRALFARGGPGALRLPGQEPFRAVLESLKLTGVSGKDLVKYAFTFVETESLPAFTGRGVYTARAGESLWDYARRFDRAVEDLLAANPQVRDLDDLPEGEEVRVP